MKSNVIGALVRIYVDRLEEQIAFYENLTGDVPHTFTFRTLHLAKVGPFLLVEGADSEVRSHSATILVRDIEEVARTIEISGGRLIEGPEEGPNGPRLVAVHGDGNVIEYIQQRS